VLRGWLTRVGQGRLQGVDGRRCGAGVAARAGRGKPAPVCATTGEIEESARAVRGVWGWRCGSADGLMMEGRDLIRRSLAIGSWVSERKMMFAANFGLWIMGE
jgi:hypothetical protein